MYLTEQDITPTSDNDRPALEITPEMVEAGVRELLDYTQSGDNAYEAVTEIWTAMQQARREP